MASVLILGSSLVTGSCSKQSYDTLFTSRSPDGAFVARLERLEEGTLGSTRYRF